MAAVRAFAHKAATGGSMYYMLHCLEPEDVEHAMLSYVDDDPDRSWHSGTRFNNPPAQPIEVEIDPDFLGAIPEFTDEPLPLMSKRLLKGLQDAGVSNLDVYSAEILDPTNN